MSREGKLFLELLLTPWRLPALGARIDAWYDPEPEPVEEEPSSGDLAGVNVRRSGLAEGLRVGGVSCGDAASAFRRFGEAARHGGFGGPFVMPYRPPGNDDGRPIEIPVQVPVSPFTVATAAEAARPIKADRFTVRGKASPGVKMSVGELVRDRFPKAHEIEDVEFWRDESHNLRIRARYFDGAEQTHVLTDGEVWEMRQR